MKISRKKVLISLAVVLLVLCCGTWVFISTVSYAHEGPVSDHFDGTQFCNIESGDHTFLDMVKWMWEMETVSWPEWIDDPVQPAPARSLDKDRLRVTYINHATVLIQLWGLNILTDPMWSARAGPMNRFGPKRVRPPGISLDSLPRIDYILISHDHWDHLDLPSMEKIAVRDQPTILVGLGIRALLADRGIGNVEEMDWWQTHTAEAADIDFTFVPARHGSGRWPFMENRTLWGGYVIEGPAGEQVYYAGDTGYGAFLDSIHTRFRRIRLAILPIGSYEKRWFMKNEHMNPDDAVQAHLLLGAGRSLGHHFGTFAEHPEQAIDAHEKDLAAALEKFAVPAAQFWILRFGEGRDVPEIDTTAELMPRSEDTK